MKNVLDSDWQTAIWLKSMNSANLACGDCSRSMSGTQNRDVVTERHDTGAAQREGLVGGLIFLSSLTVLNIHKERSDRSSTIDIANELADCTKRKRKFGTFQVYGRI